MKRVGAIISVFLLISLYVTTLICALIGSEFANAMLKASVFGTIFIPTILYVYIFLFKAINKNTFDGDDDESPDSKK